MFHVWCCSNHGCSVNLVLQQILPLRLQCSGLKKQTILGVDSVVLIQLEAAVCGTAELFGLY